MSADLYRALHPQGPGFDVAVIGFIVIVFIAYAGATLKDRHKDGAGGNVIAGAGVYGAVIGLVIAFVILPLRVYLISSETRPEIAALAGVGVFLTMFSLRRGLVGRLPFLGAHLRAFRRANLRKTIEGARAELGKLESRTSGAAAPATPTIAAAGGGDHPQEEQDRER
ncbi:MAG: hypothetical protein AAGC56_03460 [Pseudomonadota bacterium]